ncbi:MAG: hypothetical protein II894_01820 [Bacteroidales bacterium]|nr:hypothetical protein [Bacteroidales bacterium]
MTRLEATKRKKSAPKSVFPPSSKETGWLPGRRSRRGKNAQTGTSAEKETTHTISLVNLWESSFGTKKPCTAGNAKTQSKTSVRGYAMRTSFFAQFSTVRRLIDSVLTEARRA